MLPREDFVFTIGYDGPVAVVDNQAKRRYGKLSTRELAERGLFRAAYASAVYSKEAQELKFVAEAYNSVLKESFLADISEAAESVLNRLFGVFLVDVKRSLPL